MSEEPSVQDWISKTSFVLEGAGPAGPLTDLEPLREIVGDATVVALGSSTRTAHEPAVVSHRILRFLVEHLGFRSVLVEGDAAKSAELDGYVRTGQGDPRELLADARSFWRTE